MANKFANDVVLAYSRSVPLVYLATGDEPAAESAILAALADNAQRTGDPCPPVFHLDAVWGVEPLNDAARDSLPALLGGGAASMFADPLIALKGLRPFADPDTGERFGIPARAVIVWWNVDVAWNKPDADVALLRLRDLLAQGGTEATIVGLGADPSRLPPLVAADVHVLRDPLPTDVERRSTIASLLRDNDVKADDQALGKAAGLSSGLTGFQAVQAASLATAGQRLDLDVMGSRAREMLGSLPGVSLDVPEPLQYFGGMPAIVQLATTITTRVPLRLVVLLDEAEKVVSSGDGARDGGATSGIFKALLTHLTTPRSQGIRSIGVNVTGVPGTGKSTLARVIAAMAGCLIVTLDPDSFKDQYVGESKRRAEQALRAIRAFGGVQLWVATSNRTHDDQGVPLFREEWRSRFALGTWYFPAPTSAQMPAIWDAQLRKAGRKPSERWPNDVGWCGRDVADVIALADDLGCPVAEVAADHVPSLRTMASEIDARNKVAALNLYRDASTGKPYQMPGSGIAPVQASGGRKLRSAAPVPADPPAPTTTDTEDF